MNEINEKIKDCKELISVCEEEIVICKRLRNRFMDGLIELKRENEYKGAISTTKGVIRDLVKSIEIYESDILFYNNYIVLLNNMRGDND